MCYHGKMFPEEIILLQINSQLPDKRELATLKCLFPFSVKEQALTKENMYCVKSYCGTKIKTGPWAGSSVQYLYSLVQVYSMWPYQAVSDY